MAHEIPDPEEFIKSYGPEAPVVLGNGLRMTLGQALKMEGLCPIEAADRQDPVKRVGYLAGTLAAGGSLKPEDHHLLGEAE